MFRERKAWADMAAARFAAHRGKAKRMGRVTFRDGFPIRDPKFPRNASAFGTAAGTNTTALLSRPVIKALLRGRLGVTKVTGNGIDLFAGLIDKGVDRALEICKEIHDRAVAKGARAHTFGSDHHMTAARESGHVDDLIPISEAIIEKRGLISELATMRHEKAVQEGKGAKRVAFQAMPAITKTLLTKMNKAAKIMNLPKSKPTVTCAELYTMIINAGGAEALKQQLGGMLAFKDLATITVPFLSDANTSFFPAGPIIAAASQEKWINYETVIILVGVLGYEGVIDLFNRYHAKDARTHNGFYNKWKLTVKDARDTTNNTIKQDRRLAYQRALLKAFLFSRIPNARESMLTKIGFVVPTAYFNDYAKGLAAVKEGRMPNIAIEFGKNTVAELERFETFYH